MPVSSWSTTASDNATADSASGIVLSEGQAPSSLNDSVRALMAVVKGDFANSLATNGYQKFPNGLIIQWGRSSNAAAEYAFTFPIAFPTTVYTITMAPFAIMPASTIYSVTVDGLGNSGGAFRCRKITNGGTLSSAPGEFTVNWIAVGR